MTVTEVADSTGAVYQYSLKGAFRKLNGTGPPVSAGPCQSFILLGSGGLVRNRRDRHHGDGIGNMKVYGNAYINTTDGATCKAMSLVEQRCVHGRQDLDAAGRHRARSSGGTTCPPLTLVLAGDRRPVRVPHGAVHAGHPGADRLQRRAGLADRVAGYLLQRLHARRRQHVHAGQRRLRDPERFQHLSNGAVLKTGAGGVLIYLMTGQFTVAGGAVGRRSPR